MSEDLLRPSNLHNAVTFERAREIGALLTTSADADEIADAMEAAASDSDLAHGVMLILLQRLRGWPDQSGVEIVASSAVASFDELWIP